LVVAVVPAPSTVQVVGVVAHGVGTEQLVVLEEIHVSEHLWCWGLLRNCWVEVSWGCCKHWLVQEQRSKCNKCWRLAGDLLVAKEVLAAAELVVQQVLAPAELGVQQVLAPAELGVQQVLAPAELGVQQVLAPAELVHPRPLWGPRLTLPGSHTLALELGLELVQLLVKLELAQPL
ncbi:hypothetical protein EJB05_51803, partial [Eragrostis curvula]